VHFHRSTPNTPELAIMPRAERPKGTKELKMFNAKRDGLGNGANLAIPSMGEIEGHLTVLEVVAMTALRRLVICSDKHAAQEVLSDIRRAMRLKCDEIKLSPDDSASAIAYAQELFNAAFKNIEDDSGPITAPASTKRSGTRRSTPVFSS
jgi:hypothetical protein